MGISHFQWNPLKNERLKKIRKVSFEEILGANLIGIEGHPVEEFQRRMLFAWKDYVWVVPFVMAGDKIFLKTIYPSRKHTRQYLKGEGNETDR